MSHWVGINGCIGVEPYYEALSSSKYKGYKVQLGNILSRNTLIDFWRSLRYCPSNTLYTLYLHLKLVGPYLIHKKNEEGKKELVDVIQGSEGGLLWAYLPRYKWRDPSTATFNSSLRDIHPNEVEEKVKGWLEDVFLINSVPLYGYLDVSTGNGVWNVEIENSSITSFTFESK